MIKSRLKNQISSIKEVKSHKKNNFNKFIKQKSRKTQIKKSNSKHRLYYLKKPNSRATQ